MGGIRSLASMIPSMTHAEIEDNMYVAGRRKGLSSTHEIWPGAFFCGWEEFLHCVSRICPFPDLHQLPTTG